jgi:hypothetical protein
LFCSGLSLDVVITEQFYLSKRAGISISESNEIPEFEREAYINLLIKDIRKETEQVLIE